jgi:hypothetical protein
LAEVLFAMAIFVFGVLVLVGTLPNIPDMTSSTLALDDFYRYRTLTTEPFTP